MKHLGWNCFTEKLQVAVGLSLVKLPLWEGAIPNCEPKIGSSKNGERQDIFLIGSLA